mmetsp:Transcript_27552/g.66291  ORF Transcript_27552/g.66291 Transcript_27552/m.66291 type:complete len:204 (-) Transcript_27552:964-1575(-)
MSRGGGVHKRGDVGVVHGIHIRLGILQQIFDRSLVPVRAGDDQRGESSVGYQIDVPSFGLLVLLGRIALGQQFEHGRRPVLGGVHEGRDSLSVGVSRIRSIFQQHLHGGGVSPHRRGHQRGYVVGSRVVRVRVLLQQRFHDVRPALARGQPQRRHARIRGGVHLRTLLQQQVDDLDVSHDARLHKRRDAILVLGVHVRSLLEQ